MPEGGEENEEGRMGKLKSQLLPILHSAFSTIIPDNI